MSNIETIKSAIEALPESDYIKWLNEKDWDKWDKQIEADSKSGKLDFLIADAMKEKEKGTLIES